MYPHVAQFETRSQQFELESQLRRERKQARAGQPGHHPTLLIRIGSALAGRGPRATTSTSQR